MPSLISGKFHLSVNAVNAPSYHASLDRYCKADAAGGTCREHAAEVLIDEAIGLAIGFAAPAGHVKRLGVKELGRFFGILLVFITVMGSVACERSSPAPKERGVGKAEAGTWVLAIHGGAGVVSTDLPEDRKKLYHQKLREALNTGKQILASGGASLDAVEATVRVLEESDLFNAGRGAVYAADGSHELDASIMDGRTMGTGAVAGVRTVAHPISLARQVMEHTRHVLLAGSGADAFARDMGVPAVPQDYFHSERRRQQWLEAQENADEEVNEKGTVGAVALDQAGNLAAATSTGGMTNKRLGRVGDSPIVGAGTYAKNGVCAVSGTGKGEEYIRHSVARTVCALVEFGGLSLEQAVKRMLNDVLKEGDGGIIAVSPAGEAILEFNTPGMFRGSIASDGRVETAIH